MLECVAYVKQQSRNIAMLAAEVGFHRGQQLKTVLHNVESSRYASGCIAAATAAKNSRTCSNQQPHHAVANNVSLSTERHGAGMQVAKASNKRQSITRGRRNNGWSERIQLQLKRFNVAFFTAFRKAVQGGWEGRGRQAGAVLREEPQGSTRVRQLDAAKVRDCDFFACGNVARGDELGYGQSECGVGSRELAAVGVAAVVHQAACDVKTGREAVETKSAEQKKQLILASKEASVRSCSC